MFFKFSTDWTVFKDSGKEEKKKDPTASSVKCYFVRMESHCSADERTFYILSKKTMFEARSLFMHAHLLPSIDKFMARYDTCAYTIFQSSSLSLSLKINLIKCTNLKGIQVLSPSIKDLKTWHWLDDCECPKNTRYSLPGKVKFQVTLKGFIIYSHSCSTYFFFVF